jgi:2'-5' RNA ligase
MLKIISSMLKASKKGDKYDYSSTQINLPSQLSKRIIEWGNKNIPNSDVYIEDGDKTYGRENDIHVTVKYGLHTTDPNEIKKAIKEFKTFKITLDTISQFSPKDKDYDVIKIDVESNELHSLNAAISKLKNSDEHPTYKPHITIAYVKKGCGKKVIGDKAFLGKSFNATEVVFSSKDGDLFTLPLKKIS